MDDLDFYNAVADPANRLTQDAVTALVTLFQRVEELECAKNIEHQAQPRTGGKMDERYVNIGLPEDKVIEECAEVIQAITKIKRFGLMNYHPDRPESNNKIEVQSEIKDLRSALDRYEEYLTTGSA